MFVDLSPSGWIDGITAGAIIITSLLFGLISIIKGVKSSARLLIIAGVNVIIIGSYYLGPFVDFLYFGIMSVHINEILYVLLSYSQLFIGVTLISVIGGELIMPEYKQAVIGIMSALGFMYFVYLYNSWFIFLGGYPFTAFKIEIPSVGSGLLIDASHSPASPIFILVNIFQFFILLFMGCGFLVKAKQSIGDLRKKFAMLGLAFILFYIAALIDSVFGNPLLVTIARCSMCAFAPLIYLGLRP